MSKVEDLKKKNMTMIRECLSDGKIWTKNELFEKTGISKAAITNMLKILLEEKKIEFIGEANSTGGRKSKQYQLNKDYYHIAKIILLRKGENYLIIGQSIDLLDQLIYEYKTESQKGTYSELVDVIDNLVRHDKNIEMICISLPGICEDGYISICDFHELENMNLKKKLNECFLKDVIIENDVNVAAIGLSHYLNEKNLVLIYQPEAEYSGCGMIIHGLLYNGFSHFAGELRYLPFLTHQKQDEMLKEDPAGLLKMQMETICCVMNPSMICLSSDVLKKEELESIQLSLPKYHIPYIYGVEDMLEHLYSGLYFIVINQMVKGEENVD